MTGGKTDETPPKNEVKFSPGSSDAFLESDLLHMKSKEITQHVENHERKISDITYGKNDERNYHINSQVNGLNSSSLIEDDILLTMETPTDAETGITLDVSLENETETLDDDTFEEKLRGQECEDLTKNKNPGYDEFGQRSVELLKELHMPSMALIFQCDAGNGENTGKRQKTAFVQNRHNEITRCKRKEE
ncbi:hypothetical protein SK128_004190 [Halocaridina rubra]|uniref:Uncharacterized protein n=1 Tax=Halocaridina rubra TaxID=373956 RepID=A0AAN8WVR9_HALRR